MRKILALTAAVGLMAALAATAFAATKSVKVGDNWFVRSSGTPTVTVKKGDRVVWRNVGDSPHNVVVSRGPRKFRSDVLSSGDTYRKRLRVRGTYRIYCSIHGKADQSMRLVVK